jgi:hypothetical protein
MPVAFAPIRAACLARLLCPACGEEETLEFRDGNARAAAGAPRRIGCTRCSHETSEDDRGLQAQRRERCHATRPLIPAAGGGAAHGNGTRR